MELSPIDTLSICLNTVFGQSRGVGSLYISSVYRIWSETAERNFGFLTRLKRLEISGEICLFGIVKKPKFLSAVSRQKLYTDAI